MPTSHQLKQNHLRSVASLSLVCPCIAAPPPPPGFLPWEMVPGWQMRCPGLRVLQQSHGDGQTDTGEMDGGGEAEGGGVGARDSGNRRWNGVQRPTRYRCKSGRRRCGAGVREEIGRVRRVGL